MVDEFEVYAHHPPEPVRNGLLTKNELLKQYSQSFVDQIEADYALFELLKFTPQSPKTVFIRCRYCGVKSEKTTGHCVGCGAPV